MNGSTDRIRTGPTGLAARFIRSEQGRGFIAFRHHAYRWIFASFLIQQIGFWMSHVTLQGLIEDRSSDGDTLAITFLFAALFVPHLVFGPFAGAVADRVERRRMVMACYSAAAATATALALMAGLSDRPPLWAIYFLAVVLGTTFSFLGPSAGALVVNSVSREDVPSAISMQAAVQNMTRVAGPIMAVQVIGSGNFHVGFAAFAIAAGVAAAMTSRVQVAPHRATPDQLGIVARITAGYRHAQHREPAMLAITTVAVTSIFGVAHTALIPSFTRDVLHEEAGEFAKIVASTGVGAIVGALTVGYSRRAPSLARGTVALTLYGVCLLGFSLSGSLAVAMAWQVAVGFFYFATMTTLQTLVQQVVLDDMRGRVMSLFGIAWGGLVWIGTLMLGLVADDAALGLGVRTTLVLTCAVLIAYGTVMTMLGRGLPTGADYPD